MATCTTKQIEGTRYVLELTKDEAQALRDMLGHVGGHPGLRAKIEQLERARGAMIDEHAREAGVYFK